MDVDVNTGESGRQQDHGGHEEYEEVVQPALWHQQGYEQSRIFLHHANKQSSLTNLNQDLVAGYKIRCNNHSELMETLKQVPFFIFIYMVPLI